MKPFSVSSPFAIQLRADQELRFSRERDAVLVRVWFRAGDGSWRPGREGLELPSRIIDAFIGVLARVSGGAA